MWSSVLLLLGAVVAHGVAAQSGQSDVGLGTFEQAEMGFFKRNQDTKRTVSSFVTAIITKTKYVSAASSTSGTKTTSTSASKPASTSTGSSKAVFAHYMVGSISAAQAVIDITEAKAMGLDAFALNVHTTDTWCFESVTQLFDTAKAYNFKLFFSFDMSYFTVPADFFPLLKKFYSNSAYYKHNSLPFVSTFYGGKLTFGYATANAGWQALYRDALDALDMPTYFVPSFNDSSTSTAASFYDTFPMVDGQFNWDGSWPWVSQGMANVTDADDLNYISQGKKDDKTFMMGISALQFKHIDGTNNWYRRGGLSLALRIPQILAAQPDFVEIQTWNDGGESHYIGTVWPTMITGTNIGTYTDGYNHTGWQNLLGPFTVAFKNGVTSVSDVVPINGKTVQGVFWHSTLLSTARCASDPLGLPSGSSLITDVVEVAVSVAAGKTATVKVYSGGKILGTYSAVAGLNAWEVPGLTVGDVKVEVLDASGNILSSATGDISVLSDATLCNYNPQVVPLD